MKKRRNRNKRENLSRTVLTGIARAAFVTLLAFLCSMLLLEPLSFSAMSIFSSPEKNDFSVTDLYAQVANQRPVRTLDPDIVLVDIGHADRNGIANIIEKVNFWNPRAVGVDILFGMPQSQDSLLINALENTPNLVLPIGLKSVDNDRFRITDTPFFYPSLKAVYAGSNFPASFDGGTIREFVTTFPLTDGKSIPSFSMALAKAYSPVSVESLLKRGRHLETIDYPSREFVILTADDIDNNGNLITDKIVIIGAVNDANDMHSTPINSYMDGMSIHAAATATIINGNLYDPVSNLPPWLPACILCFLVLLVREFTAAQLRGIIVRLLQLVIVYLAVRIGYDLYVDHNTIFNFSYTMLMVTFGLFAADIWIGIEYLGQKLYIFARNLVNKYLK